MSTARALQSAAAKARFLMSARAWLVLSIAIPGLACSTPAPTTDAAVARDAAVADTSSTDAPLGTMQIVIGGQSTLSAVAGDVLRLDVAYVATDGTRTALPTGTTVTWSGPPTVTALPSGSTPTNSNLPATGMAPTAFFLLNAQHYMPSELAGVLFVIDAGSASGGSITVHAHVTGAGPDTTLDATIPVGAVPSGDATRGAAYYAANCASCHGATGEGGIGPGLNAAANNLGSDPTWNAELFSSVTRGDVDNQGVAEGAAMPRWLVVPTPSGVPLTTQEMVDVYAWLLTQH
jgi:mono/diheme cytochrome c family protein